jgi:hypothetical protein
MPLVPYSIEFIPGMYGLVDLAIICLTHSTADSMYPVTDLLQSILGEDDALETVYEHATSEFVIQETSKLLSPMACLRLAPRYWREGRNNLLRLSGLIVRDAITFEMLIEHFADQLLVNNPDQANFDKLLTERLISLDTPRFITWLTHQLQDVARSVESRIRSFALLTHTLKQSEQITDIAKAIVEDENAPHDLRQNIASHYNSTYRFDWAQVFLMKI